MINDCFSDFFLPFFYMPETSSIHFSLCLPIDSIGMWWAQKIIHVRLYTMNAAGKYVCAHVTMFHRNKKTQSKNENFCLCLMKPFDEIQNKFVL
jgi:hypothetical protein